MIQILVAQMPELSFHFLFAGFTLFCRIKWLSSELSTIIYFDTLYFKHESNKGAWFEDMYA